MSSCNPQKIAWVVDSIGNFVVDISIVADRNDLSHDATSLIDSQLALLSSRAQRSLDLKTNESIVSQ